MNTNNEDGERTTVMKLSTSTRRRLQILKLQLRVDSAEQAMVHLLDLYDRKNGGSGKDGVRD